MDIAPGTAHDSGETLKLAQTVQSKGGERGIGRKITSEARVNVTHVNSEVAEVSHEPQLSH